MRRTRATWSVLAVLAVAAVAVLGFLAWRTWGGASETRVVRVGLYENDPKIYTDEAGRPAGLFVDLLNEIAREEGWELEWVPCTFATCLEWVEQGRLDLMPDVAFSAERAEMLDFPSVSVANSWSQVYTRPDLVALSLSDLEGATVAMLRGGIQQALFTQLMEGNGSDFTTLEVDSLAEGYEAVRDGRADAVVTNSFFAARNGSEYQLREAPIIFLPTSLYYVTGKGANADLLAAVDAHLADWRSDAGSIYYTALRDTLAAPPELLVPRWVTWSGGTLAIVLLVMGLMTLLLRHRVRVRTADLQATTEELAHERATLETQVEERTEQLTAAKDEAEHLARVKADFLANMSHEIRTPMNAVLGMLYLALKGDLPASTRNQIGKAQSAAQSLLRVIDDILDVSKIEAGKLTLERTEFGLDTVLERLTDSVGLQAEQKGIEFLIRYDPAIPPVLVGDPVRLGQVLLNLCGNAVKFTERGQVELALHSLGESDGEVTLQIAVRDSGIGMTPEQQARVFDAFTQADQSTTRRYGGTGLGLSISSSLAALMGGRMWIEDSQPGVGTTMCVSVRLGIAHEAERHRRELVERSGPLLDGVRVLVVDDNPVSLEILADMLRYFRLEVTTAASGGEALATVATTLRPFDVVLMDWRMPGMTGDEATRRLRQLGPALPRPRVVMVTAYGREDVQRLAEQAGVDGFLLKPVSPSMLLDTVLSALGRERVLGEQAPDRPPRGTTTDGRLLGAHVLLVEDNEINREFAAELLRGWGMLVDEAVDGGEAVAKVRQGAYDAVLMDVQMPVLDGLSATRRIRALAEEEDDDRFTRLPIIAMTALAMAQDAKTAREAGMDDHVSKPIDPDHLVEVLARWVAPAGDRAPGATGSAPMADLPEPLRRMTAVDAVAGVRRIGGSDVAYVRQPRRFREHYAHAVDDLRGIAEERGVDAAEEYCHALKGVTGTIAADRLHTSVAAIDEQLKAGRRPDADLLLRAAAQLDEVVREIDALDGSAPEDAPAPAAEQLDADQLALLLGELANALQYDLGSVDVLLGRLRSGSIGGPHEGRVGELAAAVDRFDIDAALAAVHRLEAASAGTAGS